MAHPPRLKMCPAQRIRQISQLRPRSSKAIRLARCRSRVRLVELHWLNLLAARGKPHRRRARDRSMGARTHCEVPCWRSREGSEGGVLSNIGKHDCYWQWVVWKRSGGRKVMGWLAGNSMDKVLHMPSNLTHQVVSGRPVKSNIII